MILARRIVSSCLFVAVSVCNAQEPQSPQLPAGTPIVIQNLRIERIDNLIINASGDSRAFAPAPMLGRLGLRGPAAPEMVRAAPAPRGEDTRRVEFAPLELTNRGDRDNPSPNQGLEIHMLALGQADSTLVLGPADNQGKRRTLLIDLGEVKPSGRNYETVAAKVRALTNGTHLDYFVATHFHSDHVGYELNGIAGLLFEEDFTVGTVIDNGDEGAMTYFGNAPRGTYHTFEDTMAAAVGNKIQVRAKPQFGSTQINLGGNVTVEIVGFAGKARQGDDGVLAKVHHDYPTRYQNAPASENDLSITTKISRGNFEFFTAGDLTGAEDSWGGTRLFTHKSFGGQNASTYTNAESWFLNNWAPADLTRHDVEVYRANHHGSKNSTSVEFLQRLDPEFVIYSCGGKYDHPSRTVVEAVAE